MSKKKIHEFGNVPAKDGYMVTLFFSWLDELVKQGIIAKYQVGAARGMYLKKYNDRVVEQRRLLALNPKPLKTKK